MSGSGAAERAAWHCVGCNERSELHRSGIAVQFAALIAPYDAPTRKALQERCVQRDQACGKREELSAHAPLPQGSGSPAVAARASPQPSSSSGGGRTEAWSRASLPASITAWVRVCTPSLRRIAVMCAFTVASLTCSS